MIMGRINTSDLLPLRTKTCQIHRVHSSKLLGVYVDESLTWNCHIEYITAKVSKRLYLLKVLKSSLTAQKFPEEFLYCNHPSNTRILFGCLWA